MRMYSLVIQTFSECWKEISNPNDSIHRAIFVGQTVVYEQNLLRVYSGNKMTVGDQTGDWTLTSWGMGGACMLNS